MQIDSRNAISDSSSAPLGPTYAERGLTAEEVGVRVARGLANRSRRSGWADYRGIFVRNIVTLFNVLVVSAAVALFVLRDYRSAWAVSAYALINTLIGLVQEVRAKRHLDKLAVLFQTTVRVLRDGCEAMIPADDVVQDDYIRLAAGETVVADGTVLTARYLEVDEALLTGESDPLSRQPGDRLLSGSVCVAGEGSYRAGKVGGESFAQQMSALARRYRFVPSPIQRILDGIIRVLTVTAVSLCLIYVGLYYVRGFPRKDLWEMIAATVTSMVPQGLVLMTTIALTLGAVRMSIRGAIVQRLNAVESMASVDVLCMDKTGTLTTNRLCLDQVRAIDGHHDEIRARLRLFAWTSIDAGNKTIEAIRTALGPYPEEPTTIAIDQIPFKSQNRYSAVRVEAGGEVRTLVLGGFEALRPFLVPDAGHAETIWRQLLLTGLRLLLFAEAVETKHAAPLRGALAGLSLAPRALLALRDELRPNAGAVLCALAAQGIQFKILSGDHPETVRATIGHLQLPLAQAPVVTEEELDRAADRSQAIRTASVFGRLTPQRKLQIVTELQAQGHHVAMIGDGINDILPIRRSDLGIAMGSGAGAAKTVAGLVLQNNDFALLPATLDEGRTILHNLRRVSKLFLLKNVYTFILIVIGLGILGLEFPYLPQQVTLLNTLTIGVPALLMMFGKGPIGQPARAGFLREVGLFALSAGFLMAIAGLAVWLWSARHIGADPETQRTLLLTTLILLGLGNMLVVAEKDARLFVWAAVAIPLYVCVMYVGPLAHFFALTPLPAAQWIIVGAVAAVSLLPSVAVSRHVFRRGRR